MATDDSTKRCTKCGEIKTLEEFRTFAPRPSRSEGHRPTRKPPGRRRDSWCNICKAAQKRRWRKKNPERSSERCRRENLRRHHGLTPEQYDEKLQEQRGGCAICGRSNNGVEKGKKPKALAVDHDHKTGKMRDLLCTRCNNMIGNAGDDIAILEAAIAYLRRHR